MRKLLIVDDSKLIHMHVKNILSQNGLSDVETMNAFNGNEAIEAVKTFSPDLVLLDIIMPEKCGIETLKELKTSHPDMRVVMVSSMGTKEKVAEALSLGAIDFIQKPFDESELLAHFSALPA